MKNNEPAMPSNVAFKKYFGEISMSRMRCICGYGALKWTDAIRHIRIVHHERVVWKAKL